MSATVDSPMSKLVTWLRDYDCGDDIAHAQFDAAADALSSQSLSSSEARAENDRKDLEIERLKKLSDRYGVALMMIRAGCSDPARFAGNILDDRQPVNVELDEEDFDENHR